MTRGTLFRVMLVVIALSLVWSLPCVYAYWWYGTEVDISNQNTLNILYFPWVGEDILPDEGEEGETSQFDALQVILDALNNKGLSAGSKSKLNQYIDKRVKNFNKLEYGSVDMKEDVVALLNDIAEINPNFEFILSGIIAGSGKNKYVEYYYLYMIDKPQFDAATAAWEESGLREADYEKNPSIFQTYFEPVNRVLIEKDVYGQWQAIIAEIGYAGFGYYEGSNNGGGQKVWTFDPDSWIAGTP